MVPFKGRGYIRPPRTRAALPSSYSESDLRFTTGRPTAWATGTVLIRTRLRRPAPVPSALALVAHRGWGGGCLRRRGNGDRLRARVIRKYVVVPACVSSRSGSLRKVLSAGRGSQSWARRALRGHRPERIRSSRTASFQSTSRGSGSRSRNVRNGRLHFATEVTPPFDSADAYFVAVGTRRAGRRCGRQRRLHGRQSHRADREEARARRRQEHRAGGNMRRRAGADRQGRESVARGGVKPEFLKKDRWNFFKPIARARGRSEEAREMLRALYAPLQLSGERVRVTDPRSSDSRSTPRTRCWRCAYRS